ncbi:MAG TPA: NTP transferase domain-containing protein [Segeticoccus sp.]|nr:NTP transferase domain-containing protein [Segeticoccus sp.]
MADVGAIVLCGGTSRRMGGTDKTALRLGGSTVLDHLLDALPAGWAVVCVGVERATRRTVTWTREQPPGGGPVAGVAAGLGVLRALHSGPPTSTGTTPEAEVVVVLAGDQPFAAPAAGELVDRLAEHPTAAAATALDGEGRRQPLLTAYRWQALRAAVPEPAAGTPARALLGAMDVLEVPQPTELVEDVDTPEELARARRRVHRVEP